MDGLTKKLMEAPPGACFKTVEFELPPEELGGLAGSIERLLPQGTWIYTVRLTVSAGVLILAEPAGESSKPAK
jgi:hypothetical protein